MRVQKMSKNLKNLLALFFDETIQRLPSLQVFYILWPKYCFSSKQKQKEINFAQKSVPKSFLFNHQPMRTSLTDE